MEACTVETGLIKKKPCGHPAVTHCANCEQALCKQHSVAQPREAGKPAGKFMCKECDLARRAFEKNVPQSAPAPVKEAAAPAPAGEAAAKNAAPKEAPKAAPVEVKHDDGGALEFTPSVKVEEKK